MINKHNYLLLFAFITLIVFSFSSCEKKIEADNETQSVLDNSRSLQHIVSILPFLNELGLSYSPIKKTTACTSIIQLVGDTIDANNDKEFDNGAINFQMDFGTGTCPYPEGITRSGKIKVSMAKKWSAYNHTVTVNFMDYKEDDVTYTGSIEIVRKDSTKYDYNVNNVTITNSNFSIVFSAKLAISQTQGFQTKQNISDDLFEIAGETSGTNNQKRTYKAAISSELIKRASCRYISYGKCSVTPNGLKARIVNFGNGNCDDEATYIMDGQTITFKLN